SCIEEYRHRTALVPDTRGRLRCAVSFDTSTAFEINPRRFVVSAACRSVFGDGFRDFEVVVVVLAALDRRIRCKRGAFDLLYFFLREQMAESALSIPNSLRRFPRVIDGHVRAVGKLQLDLRRLRRGVTRADEYHEERTQINADFGGCHVPTALVDRTRCA